MSALFDTIGGIILVIIGFGLIGYSIYGIFTRTLRIRGGATIKREEHPRLYWALIGLWIAIGVVLLILYFVFGILPHH